MGKVIVVAFIVALYTWGAVGARGQVAALCGTDSECAKLCPKNDPECDGGPQ